MFRNRLALCVTLAFPTLLALAAENPPSRSNLSAATIAEKNAAARGGLQAWRLIQTMTMAGKLGAGGNQRATIQAPVARAKPIKQAVARRPADEVQLPFVMDLERPRKMRFELQFNGKTALQVYDGANGWKLRPYLNRNVVEPYTADEMKRASMDAGLDGFLIDFAAKGTRIELAGLEKVEDRDTYNLKLTLKDGNVMHVWVDAQTFLEAKVQGQPRRLDGVDHPVEVYYRDYRTVNGLQIPYVLETHVLPVAHTAMGLKDTPVPPEKITFDRILVNPKLDDALFAKPVIGGAAVVN